MGKGFNMPQILSFPQSVERESRRRPLIKSGELFKKKWIPVCTGNPGFRVKHRMTGYILGQ